MVLAVHQVVDRLCDTGEYSLAAEELRHAPEAGWDEMAGVERQWALRTRSRLQLGLGEVGEALRLGQEALHLAELLGTAFYAARARLVIADTFHAARDLASATDALRGARAALADSDDIASIGATQWRLARVMRLTGIVDPSILAEAWTHLAGKDVERLPDVLGCIVERAIEAASDDPERAAHLLGHVQAHRKRFVLPMGVFDEIEPLLATLRSQLGEQSLEQILASSATEGLPQSS
jgi:tetratricopeptide (TPR) repeat protein